MKYLLEKPTSAFSIFTSFVLMLGSLLGAFMTLLEDHIIVIKNSTVTPVEPSVTPSASVDVSASTPSSSSSNSSPNCSNTGQTMQIIAFLLFGYCMLALFCSVLMLLGEFYRQCCMENIDSRLGFLTSNYGKAIVNFIGGTALLGVGLVFYGDIGPGDPTTGNLLFLGTSLVYLTFILNLLRQCCGVAADGESEEVYFSA